MDYKYEEYGYDAFMKPGLKEKYALGKRLDMIKGILNSVKNVDAKNDKDSYLFMNYGDLLKERDTRLKDFIIRAALCNSYCFCIIDGDHSNKYYSEKTKEITGDSYLAPAKIFRCDYDKAEGGKAGISCYIMRPFSGKTIQIRDINAIYDKINDDEDFPVSFQELDLAIKGSDSYGPISGCIIEAKDALRFLTEVAPKVFIRNRNAWSADMYDQIDRMCAIECKSRDNLKDMIDYAISNNDKDIFIAISRLSENMKYFDIDMFQRTMDFLRCDLSESDDIIKPPYIIMLEAFKNNIDKISDDSIILLLETL